MRIPLEIASYEDLEALEHSHPRTTYRLKLLLRLRIPEGWSEHHRAIVDTGSPYSVIPSALEPTLMMKPLYRTRIGGLVPNEYIRGTMVDVECVATDGLKNSQPYSIRAIVSDRNEVPLILGLDGLLLRADIVCRLSSREAWIDLPLG